MGALPVHREAWPGVGEGSLGVTPTRSLIRTWPVLLTVMRPPDPWAPAPRGRGTKARPSDDQQ